METKWLAVKNQSDAETIPPFSVVRPIDFEVTTASLVVTTPDTDNAAGMLVTGEGSIPPSGYGKATADLKCIVAYTGGPPVFGEQWGVVAGSYKLGTGKWGFLYYGGGFLDIGNWVRTSNVSDPSESATATCEGGGGWVSSLRTTKCLRGTVIAKAGRCATIPAQTQYLKWDGGLERWKAGDNINADPEWEDDFLDAYANARQVLFWVEDGRPRCSIGGTEGIFVPCARLDCVDFEFGQIDLCDGEGDDCGDQVFRYRLCCMQCCPPDDWAGPGWYKVTEGDCETDETECVYIADQDDAETGESLFCDFVGYTICEGPFDTEEDCNAPPEVVCADIPGWGEILPTAGVLEYTVVDTDIPCMEGHTEPINWTPGLGWASANSPSPCLTDSGLYFSCTPATPDTLSAGYDSDPGCVTEEVLDFTTTPAFSMTIKLTFSGCGIMPDGYATFLITEP